MERTRPDLDYPDVESMEGVPLAKRGKCSKRQELRQKNEQTTSAYEGLEDIGRIRMELSVLGHRRITIFERRRW